jgi:hypothetical protein
LLPARFFQDKRVKVSLFMSEGIQAPNGKLVLPSCVKEGLGRVRTFGPEGKCLKEEQLELACLKVSQAGKHRIVRGYAGFPASFCKGIKMW